MGKTHSHELDSNQQPQVYEITLTVELLQPSAV